ncbi:DNA damage-binding protein 2 isoform X2 [Scleropages formosus]|uniref:DNA damage-binding protein 2 n=1 Tax=Scleropages formosus TaxID=113540 RepID=A0A8C9RC87_SCLFO|nr:DNA damage-binding protein 2 isoform X2 [Scleropages formosus]
MVRKTSPSGGRKRPGEAPPPADTLSKKLRRRKEGRGAQEAATGRSVKKNRATSIVHYIYRNSLGHHIYSQMRQCLQEPFLRSLNCYQLFRTASPFDRRITCLEWHPNHHGTLAVGSKGGDVVLWDYNSRKMTCFIQGIGAGGSITDMKFNPFNPNELFTSSVGGTTLLQDFSGNVLRVYASTELWDFWYCSVDVSQSRQMVVTGDNVGRVLLLDINGQELWNQKLHKAKVSHVEFNPCCDWLLATASVDHTVKLWDLRNIKDKGSFLHEMPHDKAVNSAYFSPIDGSKLLTTDQYDQIRVYSSSNWSRPQKVISHPHRQFQHLTAIKATWHPMYDLIVAGRYPDERVCPGKLRTVDVFDANTGALVCQLHDPNAMGIVSLNKFNPMGDVLASGMGFNMLIWTQEDCVNKQERLTKDTNENLGSTSSRSSTGSGTQRRNHGGARGKAEKAKVEKKLASLESPGTTRKSSGTKMDKKDKK